MRRLIHIADPCAESWDAMPGTESRRFCDKCGKDVLALSELSRSEAEEALERARRERLCVRVEHKDDGAVRFKREEPAPGRRGPLVSAAVGATLFVASCTSGEPGKALDMPAAGPSAIASAAVAPAEAPPSDRSDKACAPGQGAQPAGTAKADSKDRAAGQGQDPNKKNAGVTMGCVCAPGDTLCNCL